MLEAFDRLDADADGTISKRDLRGLLGNHLQDHGVEKMVDDADCAQCGKVNLETFLQLLSHENQRTIPYTSSSSEDWIVVDVLGTCCHTSTRCACLCVFNMISYDAFPLYYSLPHLLFLGALSSFS